MNYNCICLCAMIRLTTNHNCCLRTIVKLRNGLTKFQEIPFWLLTFILAAEFKCFCYSSVILSISVNWTDGKADGTVLAQLTNDYTATFLFPLETKDMDRVTEFVKKFKFAMNMKQNEI